MSKEAARKLLNVAEKDEKLRARLQETERLAEVVEIGAEYGYEFTAIEVEDLLVDIQRSRTLTDEELEQVSGGVGGGDFKSSVGLGGSMLPKIRFGDYKLA